MTHATANETSVTANEWKLLFTNINAYVNTQALEAAVSLDLFTVLSRANGLLKNEIANLLSITTYGASVLLQACCNTGLIYKKNKYYYNSDAANKMLCSDKEKSMLGYIQFNAKIQKPSLDYFIDSLRESRPIGLESFEGSGDTLYKKLSKDPSLEQIFQKGLSTYSTFLNDNFMKMDLFKGVSSLLEVAGGDGTTAIELIQRTAVENITILEQKSVCHHIQENIQKHQMEKSINCIACDVFEENFPEGFSNIFVSHFIEIFSPEKILFLYEKFYNYLPEKGSLFIYMAIGSSDDINCLQAAKSSMYFLTTAGGQGMIYSVDEHKEWLNKVGFTQIDTYVFEGFEHAVLRITK